VIRQRSKNRNAGNGLAPNSEPVSATSCRHTVILLRCRLRIAALSAAVFNLCAGFCPGDRSYVFICAPVSTGESTSVVSETVSNSISSSILFATGSAVANFHPTGILSFAENFTSSDSYPSDTAAPDSTATLLLAPKLKALPRSDSVGNNNPASLQAFLHPPEPRIPAMHTNPPCFAANSLLSRSQKNFHDPSRSTIGPFGACSPGIHFG